MYARLKLIAVAAALALAPALSIAQQPAPGPARPQSPATPPDFRALQAAQKEAIAKLAFMDGVWRGPATTTTPSGQKHVIMQTERIGPFLDGVVKVIEGRGYNEAGEVTFNALGVVSYNPARKEYSMRSYAMGHAGDFTVTVRPDGFSWEIPQQQGKILYTATVTDKTWVEVGDRILPGREPVRFFEMKLDRIGNTDWPAGSPIPPK
jgi:hypothetical protein